MMKVRPAEKDLEQLKLHLKLDFENAEPRWQCAAELPSVSIEFRDKIFAAVVCFLIRSIAANHIVGPEDRRKSENRLRVARKATRLIAKACRLFERNPPRELERTLMMMIGRELQAKATMEKIGQLRAGRPAYRAYEKFVQLLGEAYEEASGKPAIVKFNNARSGDERCSGPFAELLEAVHVDAAAIWKSAGFDPKLLNGSPHKGARLEYARKEMRGAH